MQRHSNSERAIAKWLVVRNGCFAIATSDDLILSFVYYLQQRAGNCFVNVESTTYALGLLFLNSSLIELVNRGLLSKDDYRSWQFSIIRVTQLFLI